METSRIEEYGNLEETFKSYYVVWKPSFLVDTTTGEEV